MRKSGKQNWATVNVLANWTSRGYNNNLFSPITYLNY